MKSCWYIIASFLQVFFFLHPVYKATVFSLPYLDIPFDNVLTEDIFQNILKSIQCILLRKTEYTRRNETVTVKAKFGTGPSTSVHITHFPLSVTEHVSILSGKRLATAKAAGSNCKVENRSGQNANGATAAVSLELGFPHWKEVQRSALKTFFFNLPTCFGRSLVRPCRALRFPTGRRCASGVASNSGSNPPTALKSPQQAVKKCDSAVLAVSSKHLCVCLEGAFNTFPSPSYTNPPTLGNIPPGVA